MCCGRSAEELSSKRKALTFEKGPCNKARKSQQANPDVGMYKASGMRTGMGQVQWFAGGPGVSRKETSISRSVPLVGWNGGGNQSRRDHWLLTKTKSLQRCKEMGLDLPGTGSCLGQDLARI